MSRACGGTVALVTTSDRLAAASRQVWLEAIGRHRRSDPVGWATGGPAGNARLTAWTGLVLLVLFLAELVTLLDVRGLIDWHVAIGVALVPPALMKTASTGWRILRYYTRQVPYRRAGPPPMILRLLGPLVVLSTLALLGSGLALVVVGETASHRVLLAGLGIRVDAIFIHQATFAVWAVATGLHTLGRLMPAWQLLRSPAVSVPGGRWRATAVLATLTAAAVGAGLALALGLAVWPPMPGRR